MIRAADAPTVVRRYSFKLYPTEQQAAVLHEQAGMMVDLWNALLQRHEDIWRRTRAQKGVVHGAGKTPSYYDMTAEITKLRQACPEWAALSALSAYRVARSLDEAFQAFYRRAKAGAGRSSGRPRFRARRKADAVPHRFASGCKLSPVVSEKPTGRPKNWRLTLKGVPGAIRARGEFPAEVLSWKDADVMFCDGDWWISACVEMAPRRAAGREAISIRLDLIDEFARVESANGPRGSAADAPDLSGADAENPPHFHGMGNISAGLPEFAGDARELVEIRRLQRGAGLPEFAGDARGRVDAQEGARGAGLPEFEGDARVYASTPYRPGGAGLPEFAGDARATTDRGRPCGCAGLPDCDAVKSERDRRFKRGSVAWRKYTRRAAKLSSRAARVRRERLHLWTTSVIRRAADLTVISPAIKANTATGRGDAKQWGGAVETVATLNRNTLDQAPAMAVAMLAYKAAEAGIRCDVVTDNAPAIGIGNDLSTSAKAARRVRRAIRKARAQ